VSTSGALREVSVAGGLRSVVLWSYIEYRCAGLPCRIINPFPKETDLATKRPSYLKRQKEQQRLARANSKREAKRERKLARDEMNAAPEAVETDGATGEEVENPPPPETPEAD